MQPRERYPIKPLLTRHQYGLLLVILATFLFSIKGIWIKQIYTYHIEPGLFMFLRMLMSMPFYLFILMSQKCQGNFNLLTRWSLLYTAILGVSGYYIASYLDLTGLVYLPASLERLVLYSYPAIVLLLSAVFLQQRITLTMVFSLVLVYSGLVVVFIRDVAIDANGISDQLLGALLVFASALAFAIYFIGSEVMMRRMPSPLFTALAMLAASVVISCHYLLQYDPVSVFVLPKAVYMYGFMVAVFCTVLPSFLLTSGIVRVGAAAGSLVGGVGPIMTLLLAFIFLDESLSLLQACGFVLVIAGVYNLGRLKTANQHTSLYNVQNK